METRTLGFIGLGILVGIVVATLIGIPPFIWITAAIVAIVATAAVAMGLVDGASDAARMLGLDRQEPAYGWDEPPTPTREPVAPTPERVSDVEMEMVRPADLVDRIPAVWLHRRGGRRVHRYEVDGSWVVERVSTKDPDNPRKRVIGEPRTFVSEADAIAAADELAQGNEPAAPFRDGRALAVAEA